MSASYTCTEHKAINHSVVTSISKSRSGTLYGKLISHKTRRGTVKSAHGTTVIWKWSRWRNERNKSAEEKGRWRWKTKENEGRSGDNAMDRDMWGRQEEFHTGRGRSCLCRKSFVLTQLTWWCCCCCCPSLPLYTLHPVKCRQAVLCPIP